MHDHPSPGVPRERLPKDLITPGRVGVVRYVAAKKKGGGGLLLISNRWRRIEDSFCASELAGTEPTPPSQEEQGMPAFAK